MTSESTKIDKFQIPAAEDFDLVACPIWFREAWRKDPSEIGSFCYSFDDDRGDNYMHLKTVTGDVVWVDEGDWLYHNSLGVIWVGPKDNVPHTTGELVAAALYDFVGALTTNDEVIVCGRSYDVYPIHDVLAKFAKERGIDLHTPPVESWQDHI